MHYLHGSDSLRQFLKEMPERTHSDFVVITGDMVDHYEAEEKNGTMHNCNPEYFAALINQCSVPVYLTLGNHDIASYYWNDSIRISSQKNAPKARASWIKNIACFENGTCYSKVYEVGGTTYRLIFLDNSYDDIRPEDDITIPFIDRIQMRWLKDQLSQQADDIEILFLHIAFEENRMRINSDNNDLLALLSASPSAKLILCGHNHKNISYDIYGCKQVQTGAFGRFTSNWRLIKLTPGKILISYPGSLNNEWIISLN